jgi:hypothetical protein
MMNGAQQVAEWNGMVGLDRRRTMGWRISPQGKHAGVQVLTASWYEGKR